MRFGYVVKILIYFVAVLFCAYRENGTVKFLTKGDNNSVDDRGLYAPGQLWLTKNDIVGRARGVLPYVGMITIYMNEYPNFKVSTQTQIRMTCDIKPDASITLFTITNRTQKCSCSIFSMLY